MGIRDTWSTEDIFRDRQDKYGVMLQTYNRRIPQTSRQELVRYLRYRISEEWDGVITRGGQETADSAQQLTNGWL